MTITEYEMRFVELSCCEDFLIFIDIGKVRRFIWGLNFGIKLNMDRDKKIGSTFNQVVEIA